MTLITATQETGASWLKATKSKMLVKTPSISANNLGLVVHFCNPSYSGDI
jgi:hypothetical protein